MGKEPHKYERQDHPNYQLRIYLHNIQWCCLHKLVSCDCIWRHMRMMSFNGTERATGKLLRMYEFYHKRNRRLGTQLHIDELQGLRIVRDIWGMQLRTCCCRCHCTSHHSNSVHTYPWQCPHSSQVGTYSHINQYCYPHRCHCCMSPRTSTISYRSSFHWGMHSRIFYLHSLQTMIDTTDCTSL